MRVRVCVCGGAGGASVLMLVRACACVNARVEGVGGRVRQLCVRICTHLTDILEVDPAMLEVEECPLDWDRF